MAALFLATKEIPDARMRIPRPKSLNGLILIGLALVALPLLIAVVRAAYQMDKLANESEALVLQGVEATRLTQQLFEDLTEMNRAARFYRILGNTETMATYQDKHRDFVADLDALDQLPEQSMDTTALEKLRSESSAMLSAIQQFPYNSDQLDQSIRRFADMAEAAASLTAQSNRFIDQGLSSLLANAREAQRTLFWQTAALIPGTLVLVLIFTLLVARPIRQIDKAIGELGKGTFSRPVAVSGPSDLEALGHQLEWLRQRLLELAQEKNRFLRHMSHELKTPLSNIREGSELLIDGSVGDLDESQREVATILRDNSLRLQQLIENLLSFSAWQTKSAELELSHFSLARLFQQVVKQHTLVLKANNVTLDARVQDLSVYADRYKLRMVLDNLLSNATKFTPENGTITIRARGTKDQLIIDIADSGPGIPVAERGRIFEAFYQGKTPQGGTVQGTGIGLSVVFECVNAHGGTVEIIDGEHQGAHFRIHLPLERAAQIEAVAASA